MPIQDAQHYKALIIDDNDLTRSVLRMIVQNEGFKLVEASASGKGGLAAARTERPDIICLDIVLPDSDGLELLGQIKAILPQSVVLMVTGSNDRETFDTAIRGGAEGFILKPFNVGTVVDSLTAAVKVVAGRRQGAAPK